MTPSLSETSGVTTVGVVGAGLAGLAAAFRLRSLGLHVTVFEAGPRTGGMVRSWREDGFLAEGGPHSLSRPSPEIRALFTEAGLDERRVAPDPDRSARFIVRDGRPIALPTRPTGLLTTPLLSPGARLRVLAEPLRRRSRPPEGDESVADLLRRRGLGQEFVDRFLDPFVAGVYAGNPERLSVQHAFPLLHDLERERGSLVRGVLARARRGRAGREGSDGHPPIFSFREGMEEIPRALARGLEGRIHLDTPITGLHRSGSQPGQWELTGAGGPLGAFDRVLLALPAHRLAELDLPDPTRPHLQPLSRIDHPPIVLLTLGFARQPSQHPMDGFGMLIPKVEEHRILGALFPSTLFPDRAPDGHVSVAVFVGGTRQPELAHLDDDELDRVVLEELEELLGIRGRPVFRRRMLWERSIPQRNVGYGDVLDAAAKLEEVMPGVVVAGSWRDGVSVGDALGSGLEAAARVTSGRCAVG